jgi:hypothetical protein
MASVPTGELPDLLDTFLTPFGHHLGGTELESEIGTLLVPSHQDGLLGAEPFGGQHRAQADGAVANYGDRREGPTPAVTAQW